MNPEYAALVMGANTTEVYGDLPDRPRCGDTPDPRYESSVLNNITLAMPEWEAALTAITLSLIILLTIVGNILVILSVFTYKPLRIVQNFFIVSLAVADLTVAILVLPFNVAWTILGQWHFGIHVCKMWLTCDVLCCTASILNLCAIALDRYWAITDPINYAQKRTLKRVLLMIAGLWLLSGVISSPPLIGWNDWPDVFQETTPCELTQQQGYVVYSSLGSFYIPLFIMTIVYIEIFIATKRRLRERARASKLNAVKQNVACMNQSQATTRDAQVSHDQESVSSETNHNEHPPLVETGKSKDKKRKGKKKKKNKDHDDSHAKDKHHLAPMLVAEDSVTDNSHDPPSATPAKNSQNHCGGEDGQTTTTTTTTAGDSPHSRILPVTGQSAVPTAPSAAVIGTLTPTTAASVAPKKGVPVYAFIEEKQRISLSKERRAARTLGIIMGVFVVCWLPFFLMYVILPFCTNCCPSKKVVNFITWLGYINSALNPIIYTIFNLDFRRAFKKLLHIKP
ncbi:hypothetical protein R5R35_005664 [Gryllus longicercus]|uniref:G-protein coupled receptors family 1 profile domain-containing protein n=1 Tax=Gryllus longicercus TaxID=2509291 RepID=A0AAN9Z3I3_9ORTH